MLNCVASVGNHSPELVEVWFIIKLFKKEILINCWTALKRSQKHEQDRLVRKGMEA
jgi:hypothetical protein